MKIELEEKDINAIAQAIINELKPIIAHGQSKDEKYSEFLDTSDVAAYLNLSPSGVSKMVRERKLPCFKIGGKVRMFRKRDIDQWLNSFKFDPLQLPSETEKKKKKRDNQALD